MHKFTVKKYYIGMCKSDMVDYDSHNIVKLKHLQESKQGHHHNGDQAARRPNMMCSICVRRSTPPLFGVRADRADLIR